jgi:hypothetical protein
MSVFIPGWMAITGTRVVSTWVYDTSRADLIVQNQKKLQEMNVPDASIHAFIDNKAFPMSVQTAFVEDPTRVSGIPGSIDIVAPASTAESEEQARFLASCLDILANYHQSHSRLVSIYSWHHSRPGSSRHDRRSGRGRLRLVDQTHFVFRRPAGSRIDATKLLALWPNVVSREKNFQALGWSVREKTRL